jgi:hypothetical protein
MRLKTLNHNRPDKSAANSKGIGKGIRMLKNL